MKSSIPVFASLMVASAVFIQPIAMYAQKQPSTNTHIIGFIKAPESKISGVGVCGYWLVGSKNENDVVFLTGVTEKPLINIDGKNIALRFISKKEIRRNNRIVGSVNEYKSNKFKVVTNFRDVTTSGDRKGFGYRERGSILVVSDNGWRKKVEAECVMDIGG